MHVLGVDITEGLGCGHDGVAGLDGLNSFWRRSTHEAYADRIAAVLAYRRMLDMLSRTVERSIEAAAGEQLSILTTAEDLVERMGLRVGAAEILVNDARRAISGKSLPSSAPPSTVSTEDWSLAYGIDIDKLRAALVLIDEVRVKAEDAANDALRQASALKVKRGQASPLSIPPKSSPAKRVEWKDPELVVRPEIKKAIGAVGATIANAAGGIGFGIIVVLAGAAFLVLGGLRGRR